MSDRLLAVTVMLVLGLPALALGQTIAVYESETNAEEYHGVYQEPLRTWLTQRGQTFEVIGDEIASDAGRLGQFALVMASSAYLVPESAGRGLAEYLAGGGRVIWVDSPARSSDPELRAALGLQPGSTYVTLSGGTVEAMVAKHPAALSSADCSAKSLTGNPAVDATEQATVLYQLRGTTAQGDESAYPAVILGEDGEGKSLVYNWIIWLNREPEVRALLDDGLGYMLADYALGEQDVAMLCGVIDADVRQPAPVVGRCKVYRRAEEGEGQAFRCEAALLSPERNVVAASPTEDVKLTHADHDIEAGVLESRLETDGLTDGAYTVRWQLSGGEVSETREAKVELQGERWAALKKAEKARRKALEPLLLGTLGDYDAEPRTPEGRVDIPRLLEQIETAHMDMYDWLIWHAETDWEDFEEFLPIAHEKGIKVWITLCPPSEQGGGFPWSEPYRLDFIKWADEIGKLAEEYDNLVAFVIDDFWSGGNRELYTPDYIRRMVETLRGHNPKLAFLPTIYSSTVGDQEWIEQYGPLIDGIVYPYREYVTGDVLAGELEACREWIGPDKFLLVNVYASGSGGGAAPEPRTEDYMRKTLTVSREESDGIRIYCLPKANLLDDHRYAVTAELYGKWRQESE